MQHFYAALMLELSLNRCTLPFTYTLSISMRALSLSLSSHRERLRYATSPRRSDGLALVRNSSVEYSSPCRALHRNPNNRVTRPPPPPPPLSRSARALARVRRVPCEIVSRLRVRAFAFWFDLLFGFSACVRACVLIVFNSGRRVSVLHCRIDFSSALSGRP